jgi:SpoVK/Ycf46/Vps4 family AAA+-type ATPase
MNNTQNMDLFDKVDIDINWRKHLEETNSKINNMWSYMIYNNFCEKEIINLKNENKELRRDYEDLKSEICCLRLKNKENNETENASRKRKPVNSLINEYKKIKRYKKLSPEEFEETMKETFNKLNSIDDIINLQSHPHKFDFINNDKFNKLYNIIKPLEELQNIIGMKNVKEQIFRSICYFLHKSNNISNEMNHIMIMGPPGVGKTTIAQIMGKIYLELGFLENDKFITASRSDLVAKYLGQTADKTQKVIDSALGGVLFIDEVYSLGNNEGRDSFAKECIDTINLNMSRTDKPWLLIVAGYKEDIENSFLAYNKGLERRFTVKLEINSYNNEELFEILSSFIISEGWSIEANAITIKDIDIKLFKYFGGDMRKLFQLAKENYCVRSMKTVIKLDKIDKKLTRDDFLKSIEHFKKANKKDENTSHHMMYI